MNFPDQLLEPWPWYIAGPLIGLVVPALLLAGNKGLGISSSLRQICALCLPANIPFLKYDWKAQSWNLFFAIGLVCGGFIGAYILPSPEVHYVSAATLHDLQEMGISAQAGLLPAEIFSWQNFYRFPNIFIVIGGGFLVGFGTRWAGGCTSGHGIYGLATFQWPSLVAVIIFFAAGIFTANYILPLFFLNNAF